MTAMSQPPHPAKHLGDEDEQRIFCIDWVSFDTTALIMELTNTVAANEAIDRQITAVGIAALRYKAELAILRRLIEAAHD